MRLKPIRAVILLISLVLLRPAIAAEENTNQPLQISGIYPHLAMFNTSGECGIGAVVPWAGKLWVITYPPHLIKGSDDKLYAISPDMSMEIRPESVGGTHANRMIHRESNQLSIGPYLIDDQGKVRALDLQKLVGRMTATARHLTDPANKIYIFDMEGMLYEVDVRTLDVKKLFDRVAPGAHGKGGYTSQGRLVVSNNGESVVNKAKPAAPDIDDPKKNPEVTGSLSEWDGKNWRVVERRQFTEVTGPGGINGAPDEKAPLWAVGWDKRSVILMLLDNGQWHKFRLPKATHTYDPRHGWFTEWPRIREIEPAKEGKPARLMMDMHGMFYDFPQTFSAANTAGIAPIASHLRYVPDFGHWNGRVMIASDDTSIMQNPMAGISQSNIWFGAADELPKWGPKSGWGGVWLGDEVKANTPSDPFLFNGFEQRVLHLAHNGKSEATFTVEVDAKGDGKWSPLTTVKVPAGGYGYHLFPQDAKGQWVRVSIDKDCTATAYFHYTSPFPWPPVNAEQKEATASNLFKGLADVGEQNVVAGFIRPAKNKNLQFLVTSAGGKEQEKLFEADEKLSFSSSESGADEVKKLCAIKPDFKVDAASVIFEYQLDAAKDKKPEVKRLRLPKGDPAFDKPFAFGWPRGIREVQSERYLMNIHGTFYELSREKAHWPYLRPVASHNKQIMDFCSWRGLLVLSGVKASAETNGNTFGAKDGSAKLVFCKVDDLWQLGQPVGVGGPWAKTAVKASEPSDPYLMTGYATKKLEITVDGSAPVTVTAEVDVDHTRFRHYATFTVEPGKPFVHNFPAGYSAHWIRLKADKDCTATATFTYTK